MRCFLIILITLSPFFLKAQLKESSFDASSFKFINTLIEKDITSIGYLNEYCVGYIRYKKPCEYEGFEFQSYIFWLENDIAYLKKYDNCGGFKTLKFNIEVFEFYNINKEEIKDEFIRDYTEMSIENGDTNYYTSNTSHSCHTKIIMIDSNDTVYQSFNHYDMSGKEKNINYSTNNNLKLKLLYDLFSKNLEEILKTEDFTREGSKDIENKF